MIFTPTIEPRKIKFDQLKIGQRYKDNLFNNSYSRILRASRKGNLFIKHTMDNEQDEYGINQSINARWFSKKHEVFILEE